ncbi:23S rRNA (adenine(2503)-C(2))-methyltransferase @ tRNA (adenine(37)-C(2))-methyltransferase [hydrothermal vent metagenome]|uniref:23S rRNA (Adenine(2503)-C(2))-methyltransferase @ tRNA (Adenine(37)-C(2))-methyltransferase n=1 Tax=hydrothermal vent metagenome TaxID=652676 RepID=A0A3B1DL69_9ZZZZ
MPATDIRNFTHLELTNYFISINEKSFRAQQVFEWIYQKGINSFDAMKNLPQLLRDSLKKDFIFKSNHVDKKEISKDGTTKFLFDLEDHQKIETVLIPTATRSTVCVSTQAGCKFGCKFCASGLDGWKRNLTSSEIIDQILQAKEESKKHKKPLSHVVYMGTGESFDNFDNVMKSIRILNDKQGLNIGARRITVSTCGVIPKLKQFAKEGLQIELAISLHGYDNASRNVLMPVNKKYPFDELMVACREYVQQTKRQITFEYILIKDVTCTQNAVQSLKKAFKGIICKMNLIPYNFVKEFDYQSPTHKEVFLFKKQLDEIGIHATIRRPRGKDINGACGQLRHLQEMDLL